MSYKKVYANLPMFYVLLGNKLDSLPVIKLVYSSYDFVKKILYPRATRLSD